MIPDGHAPPVKDIMIEARVPEALRSDFRSVEEVQLKCQSLLELSLRCLQAGVGMQLCEVRAGPRQGLVGLGSKIEPSTCDLRTLRQGGSP